MSKNTIAIFCRSFKPGGDPFTSDYYWQAYQDLYFALKARGMRVYFATDNNTYLGDGRFSVAYRLDKKTTLENLEPVHNVRVDMVFDRGGFIGRDVLTVNNGFIQRIGMSKIEMYKLFGNLQPYSIICNNKKEVIKAFGEIEGDNIVVKEPEGQGGKEVYIGKKHDIIRKIPDIYPVLVQEFMDTSAGIPGYINGIHDIRLSICGGEIIGYYVRKAQEGKYHSNVSQGGTMVFFDTSEVPFEAQLAAKEIDAYFEEYPRYFAADFMLTPKGWKLLEINPYLALLPKTDGELAIKTHSKLADYLAEVCTKQIHKYDLARSHKKR
jgi:glutathione synthase/RimK-type ligase-like ATP-grasp enzyme